MSLFKKKACCICGVKIGFSALCLAGDKKICTACEALLRGNYNFIRRGAAFYDTLAELDPYFAKQIIDEMKETQREDIARYDDIYSGIISVINKSYVPLSGLEEGGLDISDLLGKPVYIGFCEKGTFNEGDKVRIIGRNCEEDTTIIKLIPCTGAYSFEEELISKSYVNRYAQNHNAWMILGTCHDNIEIHDKIVKY